MSLGGQLPALSSEWLSKPTKQSGSAWLDWIRGLRPEAPSDPFFEQLLAWQAQAGAREPWRISTRLRAGASADPLCP